MDPSAPVFAANSPACSPQLQPQPRVPSVAPQKIYTFAKNPSWSQHFANQPDGPLSLTYWNIETGNNNGWGNNEVQYYTSRQKNIHIAGGNLALTSYAENYQNFRYTSARITTANKFDFKYGRLQIVAKIPTGAGVWPAIWLWPTDTMYSTAPLATSEQDLAWLANGEVDIAEGSAQGDGQFSASAHAVRHYPEHGERTGTVDIEDPARTYHTYELGWTPDELDFRVDGETFHTVHNSHTGFKDWPYDQRYHLILNTALGGDMSKNLAHTYPDGIDSRHSPWAMQIKSIDYYPLLP